MNVREFTGDFQQKKESATAAFPSRCGQTTPSVGHKVHQQSER